MEQIECMRETGRISSVHDSRGRRLVREEIQLSRTLLCVQICQKTIAVDGKRKRFRISAIENDGPRRLQPSVRPSLAEAFAATVYGCDGRGSENAVSVLPAGTRRY